MSEKKSKDEMIPKRELWEYRAELKGQLFRALREMLSSLKRSGVNQATIVRRLQADPGRISKRLSGKENMTLETISDLARAMECRVDVKLTHFSEVAFLKTTYQQANAFSIIIAGIEEAGTVIPYPSDLDDDVIQHWEFEQRPIMAIVDSHYESNIKTDELLVANG